MADGRCFEQLKTGWGVQLTDDARREFEEQAEGCDRWHLEEYLKDSDIRKFRLVPTLPKEVSRIPAGSTLPSGRYVVQVIRVADVTQPSKFQEEFEGGKYRLLSLDLTDGDQKFKAIEYTSIKDLGVHLPPGTKLLLSSSDQKPLHVQNGHLLLEPGVVTVLGGNVEKLLESWHASREVEEKRLLWRTEGIRKKEDGEGAPLWIDYDPKLARGKSSSTVQQAFEEDKAFWRKDTGGTADPVQSSHVREKEASRFQVHEFAAEGKTSSQAVKSQVASNAFAVSSGKGGWSKGGKDGKDSKGGDRGGKGKEKGGGKRRGGRTDDWEEEKRAPQAVNTLAAFIKPTKKGELPDEAVASLLDTAAAEPAGAAASASWAGDSWDAAGWSGGGWAESSGWSSGGGGGGNRKGGGRKGGGKGGGNRKGGGGKRH